MASDLKITRKKDMAKLRGKMDGDDRFFGSHQIKKIRTRERDIPAWALNDKEVRKVLLRAFPKLHTNKASSDKAGRWMRLIHLYYRVQMSNSQVAKEMDMTLSAVKSMIINIRRVAKGQRADTRGPRSTHPRGRPKK
jgi:hypothetical protein